MWLFIAVFADFGYMREPSRTFLLGCSRRMTTKYSAFRKNPRVVLCPAQHDFLRFVLLVHARCTETVYDGQHNLSIIRHNLKARAIRMERSKEVRSLYFAFVRRYNQIGSATEPNL